MNKTTTPLLLMIVVILAVFCGLALAGKIERAEVHMEAKK